MNEIIPVFTTTIGNQEALAVDLRKVHAFLRVRTKFAEWIKDRIRKFGFAQGIDFVIFSENSEKLGAGAPAIEYHGTIGMAKELAMVQNNAKGKEARLYFLECERRAKAAVAIPDLNDPAVLRRLLFEHNERLDQAQKENTLLKAETVELKGTLAANAPKVEFVESFQETGGNVCINDAAKHCGVRPKWLHEFMFRKGFVGRRSRRVDRNGRERLGKQYAKQKWIDRGFLVEEPRPYPDPVTGEQKVGQAPLVTPAGVCYLRTHAEVKVERERIEGLMRRKDRRQGEMTL